MPSLDSLEVGLGQRGEQERKIEELKEFRREILKLFKAEIEKTVTTAHFTNPDGRKHPFRLEDLDLSELHLWQGYKACSLGQRPLELCLIDLDDYKKSLDQKSEIPLAKTGLVSYIGNKLTALYGQEELERRRKERQENCGG